MIIREDKNKVRQKRHLRVRGRVSGTADTPRFNVYRSNSNIYVQIIDDDKGNTLCASSSLDKSLEAALKGKRKAEQARIIGAEAAKKALALKIESVVFDRGGYLYTGRVKQVADGAREAGLKF